MRLPLFSLAIGLGATVCCAQTPPVFSSAERDAVLAFWGRADRYTTTVPDNAMDKGIWQVRLTPEGSTWLWNYNRARKAVAPPTADAPPANDDQKAWEGWIAARIAHDRWDALQIAIQSNQRVLGKPLPSVDPATPATPPPDPGPVPDGLFAIAGNPPKFARAVVPMQHQVKFDDLTITYQDNIRTGNQRYPYLRFAQGVQAGGTAVKDLPSERMDRCFKQAGIGDSEARVMRAVSILEGGFDAVNTYDTGFVSVGFIQFACLREGGGSMGGMLLAYKTADPNSFQKDFRDFGIDVTPAGLLCVIDPTTGAQLAGPDAAQRIIEDKRLIAVFQRAGQLSDAYVAAQIRAAKAMYDPADDPISVTVDGATLTGKVSDIVKSEAGMATLLDRKVNTGKIALLLSVVAQVAAEVHATSISDLGKYELEIIDRLRYRRDYLADPTLSQPGPNGRPYVPASHTGGGREPAAWYPASKQRGNNSA